MITRALLASFLSEAAPANHEIGVYQPCSAQPCAGRASSANTLHRSQKTRRARRNKKMRATARYMRIISPAVAEQGKRPQRAKKPVWPLALAKEPLGLAWQLLIGRSRRGVCKKCRPLARSRFGPVERKLTCPALRRGPVKIKHLGYVPSEGSNVLAHCWRPN